jgi:hypothetical protein
MTHDGLRYLERGIANDRWPFGLVSKKILHRVATAAIHQIGASRLDAAQRRNAGNSANPAARIMYPVGEPHPSEQAMHDAIWLDVPVVLIAGEFAVTLSHGSPSA